MAERIVSSLDTLSGKPRIAGTRISVEMILEDLASGMSPVEIIETYPQLTVDDIAAAADFALQTMRGHSIAAE